MKIHTDIDSIQGIERPILTIGTFDGVHLGHRVIIDRLNELARTENGESVLLTFHPHPRTVVSESHDIELLSTMDERLELLEKAGLQHVVIHPFTKEFSRIPALEYVRDLLVNKIGVYYAVVGYDHHFGRNREGDITLLLELADLYDFKVEEISAQTIQEVEVSSTKVRNALKDGSIHKVHSFLGYHYSVKGTVVRGDGRGRGLGFPTANILPDDGHKLIPAIGVYAVKIHLEGQCLDAMLNIGIRPTFSDSDSDLHIEAHIFNLNEDLYGRQLRVELLRKVRDEMKFSNSEALVEQLQIDAKEVKEILGTY